MKKIYINLGAGITDSLDRFNQTTYLYPETKYIIGIFISKQFLVRNNLNKDSFNKLFAIQKDLIIFEDELPEENVEKNSFFDEEINDEEDFEFNLDFEIEEGTRSPGWIRYQKRIK